MCDFTKYKHPVLAVSCPSCKAKAGAWCKRPSEHKAMDFHKSRGQLADKIFIDKHGKLASIERADGGWVINPAGRTVKPEPKQFQLF